ncbi:protein rhiA [Oxalobacteraceae sp. CFBP 13730]|nr:protein rhiA [Oxalobacteraceae sp. CFBP 13730]
MSTPYNLTLKNQSAMPWTFYVYQQAPNQQSSNVFSLAWFASPFTMAPGTQISFDWHIDYGFVWGATGEVRPGITFKASDCAPAGLTDDNTIKFSNINNTPDFSQPATGNPSGSLVITDASNVPNSTFMVGISMSGAGTFVTPAGPNLIHTFTPTPTYWIAAGTDVQVGTILDITTINQNKMIEFPVNTYDVTYSLGQDNVWVQV